MKQSATMSHHEVNMNVRHPPPPFPRIAPSRKTQDISAFLTQFEPLVNASNMGIYKKYRKTVLDHIKNRREKHNFEPTDEITVDLLARNLADYLYLEEYATQTPENLSRNTDALNKLNTIILHLLDELILTPKGRRRIWEDLKEELKSNAQVKEALEKLMGTPKRPRQVR